MQSINTIPSWITDSEASQIVWHRRLARQDQALKYGVWVYFLLLIFEGALRKWFLPDLATPFLVIRDPLALWILIRAWTYHRLPMNPYLTGTLLIGIIGLLTAILVGHGNWTVAIFGARILLLHFPLIFVIGRVFTTDDVRKLGKISLWLSIPMTLLIALQFYNPQSAWVNRGLGADIAGAGFSGALGYFRPPATFSFANGTTLFYSFVASFVFYFWLNPNKVNRGLLIGSTLGLLAAIPLSISRGLLFQLLLTILFTIIAVSWKPNYLGRMLLAIMGMSVVAFILNQTDSFQTSLQVLIARFETASMIEGGIEGTLGNRFIGGLVYAITSVSEQPFWGYGLGMGTNVGAQLLVGDRSFLISEDEWGRSIGELGTVMGLGLIILRVSLTANLSLRAYKRLRQDDLLPWMLLSFGAITLSTGSWAQPTSLGFCIMVSGLLLASLREKSQNSPE